MFIWAAKIRPKVASPNIVTFNSHNEFELLRFMKNSPDFWNNIDSSEESDLHEDRKRTVKNFQQISK